MNKGVAPTHWRDNQEDMIEEDNEDENMDFRRKDEDRTTDQHHIDQMM